MTEYDFSPEAQDRYQATMQRISRWVDDTEAHKGEFRCAVETEADARGMDMRSNQRDLGRDLNLGSSSKRRGASLDARPAPTAIYAPFPGPMPSHFLSPPPQSRHGHHRSHPASRHATPNVYAPVPPYGPPSSSTTVYGTTTMPLSAHRSATPPPVPVYVSPPPAPPSSNFLHAPKPRYAPSPVPQWSQAPPQPPLQPHHSRHHHSSSYHHQQQHSFMPGPTPYIVVPPPGALNMRVVPFPEPNQHAAAYLNRAFHHVPVTAGLAFKPSLGTAQEAQRDARLRRQSMP